MAVDHLALLRAESARVGIVARSCDHGAPLRHLPGWTAGDVVAHLVGDVIWVLDTVRTRQVPASGIIPSVATGTALCDEWDDVAATLIDTLAGVDPDEPCPNFAQGASGRLGFHVRHQAFETLIHRWDVESTTGEHAPIDSDAAADAIDELLVTYTARYAPHTLAAPLVVACDDARAAWRLTPGHRVGSVTVERCDGDTPDVTAGAAALLLTLWRRLGPDDGQLTHRVDPAAMRAFLAGPVTA